MNIEQHGSDSEQDYYTYDPQQYQYQKILQRNHQCFGPCLDYNSNQTRYKLRLKQEAFLNYSLSHNDAQRLCVSIIQESQQQYKTKKQKQIKKPTPFQNQSQSFSHIKQIIRKLSQNKIPILIQAAVTGFSETKLRSIQKGINQEKADEQHHSWMNKYMQRQTQRKLCCMQNIYEDFLHHFKLSKNSISKSSLNKIIKSLEFTYKTTSRVNFKATTSSNKSKQYLYALTILSHFNEARQLIYIDETGIGKDYISSKVWCNKNETFYVDRTEIRTMINIIGAMSKDLLVYQCLKCNVNAQLTQNFLIRLINTCNQLYGLRNYVFIMDNASIHIEGYLTREVLRYVNHLYLPPYSPQLNPIERVWGQFKNNLSKQDCRTGMKLNEDIHNCFNLIKDEHLLRYYQSVFKVIEKCLRRVIYENDVFNVNDKFRIIKPIICF